MPHLSIPKDNAMEFISETSISPLIDKCCVKVCYIGQNRNGTQIDKSLAQRMGQKLPGSPVVGFYNKETKDFEEHNRQLDFTDDSIRFIDVTKPYGFVPTNAKVWFQKFIDDGVEHEYLCTEAYIWTGAYPESKRVIEKGNNQSMELNRESEKGFWTNDINSGKRIFIINEALIEKLCILGEDFEPCFEGAQIKTTFSFDDLRASVEELQTQVYALIQEISKGGSNVQDEEKKNLIPEGEDAPTEEYKKQEEENSSVEDKEGKDNNSNSDNKSEDSKNSGDEDEEDEGKDKKKYVLADIPEYISLQNQYKELESKFAALEQANSNLTEEVNALKQFKLTSEREAKQEKIDEFYMLTDEDKADVVTNIDSYSLDEIEAKLCVLCYRNKVNFVKAEEGDSDSKEKGPSMFGLNNLEEHDSAPEWVKSVRRIQNKEE